ncbi:thioredoxin family protein [Paenibacillus soyae]|uniref:Thioredoxin n=1 Tax=Paenibacillus soyae TaxID=2969249 RepID=A0A9X2MSU5_9BACL|nr:thioredoxin family protein [Paenibacillus soyae]MCR2805810.1 thioredoxin family protein [Paenibacillus soyae]
MSVKPVNSATFKPAIREKGVTLAEFGAVWCPPCKTLLPILHDLADSYGESVSVLQVDCDESPDLAGEFGVMSMPTVIVFRDGEPVERLVGLRPRSLYEQIIERNMAVV